MFGGGPKPPAMPIIPPAAHPPILGSTEVMLAGIQSRQKAIAEEGEGDDSTVATSEQGVAQPASKAPGTLLG